MACRRLRRTKGGSSEQMLVGVAACRALCSEEEKKRKEEGKGINRLHRGRAEARSVCKGGGGDTGSSLALGKSAYLKGVR